MPVRGRARAKWKRLKWRVTTPLLRRYDEVETTEGTRKDAVVTSLENGRDGGSGEWRWSGGNEKTTESALDDDRSAERS